MNDEKENKIEPEQEEHPIKLAIPASEPIDVREYFHDHFYDHCDDEMYW